MAKEFFEMLKRYPSFDPFDLGTGSLKVGPDVSTMAMVSSHSYRQQNRVNVLVVTREVERVESVFASDWTEHTSFDAQTASQEAKEFMAKTHKEDIIIGMKRGSEKHGKVGKFSTISIHFLPLPSSEEALEIVQRSAGISLSESDARMFAKVFGGVPGNLTEAMRLQNHSIAAARGRSDANMSILDCETVFAEIKINASMQGANQLAQDCRSVALALNPFSVFPLLTQGSAERFAVFGDIDYMSGSFNIEITWELSKDSFRGESFESRDRVATNEGSSKVEGVKSSRFVSAWRELVAVGWIRATGIAELFTLSHPSLLVMLQNEEEDTEGSHSSESLRVQHASLHTFPSIEATTDNGKEDSEHSGELSVRNEGSQRRADRLLISQCDKYLSISAHCLREVDDCFATMQNASSRNVPTTALNTAVDNHFRQCMLLHAYDCIQYHINMLLLVFDLKSNGVISGMDRSTLNHHTVAPVIENPFTVSSLERYYQLSRFDVSPPPLHVHCGLFSNYYRDIPASIPSINGGMRGI